MSVLDLQFPVLAITCRGFVHVVKELAGLEVCNAVGVRKGYYKDLELIDQEGNVFVVESVQKLKVVRRGLSWMFGNPTLHVKVSIRRDRPVSLDSVKDQLRTNVMQLSDFWEESTDIEELLVRIREALTIQEIICLFTELTT